MNSETLAALVSIPAAIAVIVTIGLFLKHITEQRKEDRVAVAAQREADRLMWGNHLSQVVVSQKEIAGAVGQLVTTIAVMQTNNENSMAWAREAMQSLIREVGRSSPIQPPPKP